MSPRSRPSILTVPDQGESRPQMSLATVDLPLPELPTSATRRPGSMESEKSSISGGPLTL